MDMSKLRNGRAHFRKLGIIGFKTATKSTLGQQSTVGASEQQRQHFHQHYENTPIWMYWKFYNQKTENFQIKNSIFYNPAQNIDCEYS